MKYKKNSGTGDTFWTFNTWFSESVISKHRTAK